MVAGRYTITIVFIINGNRYYFGLDTSTITKNDPLTIYGKQFWFSFEKEFFIFAQDTKISKIRI